MKLFIDNFEYDLEYIKLINKKYIHFSVIKPTSFIFENFNLKNNYMTTIHFNNQIFDMGENIKTYKKKNNNYIYYIGDNITYCVCLKYEPKYKISYPLFVSLPVNLISGLKRNKK